MCDKKIKKVHGLKHFLMLVLVSVVNIVYHADVSAYVCQSSQTAPSGYAPCIKASSYHICNPDSVCASSKYLCLTYAEYASIGNNAVPYCSTKWSGYTGTACWSLSNFTLNSAACVAAPTEVKCASGMYVSNGTCTSCTAGFYMPTFNNTASTCIQCPKLEAQAGTAAPGANAITKCYMASIFTIREEPGHLFKFTSDCYYTN